MFLLDTFIVAVVTDFPTSLAKIVLVPFVATISHTHTIGHVKHCPNKKNFVELLDDGIFHKFISLFSASNMNQ